MNWVLPELQPEIGRLNYLMEASEHTFPLPEIEAHKLDVAQHELESPESETTSPFIDFLQSNKWSLITFGALGLGIGLALRRRRR